MAVLMRFHLSTPRSHLADRLQWLLVITALAVVCAPTVSWASMDQEAQSISRLAADVNSADVKVRRAALKALATRGPEALEPLSLLVGDPERAIRGEAIDAIVAIYVEPPPRERISNAEDAFAWTRYRTTPWPLPAALVTNLVRGLADEWPSIRRDAAYGLGIVMTPPIASQVEDELIYSLADPDASVRVAAARALGRLRATRAGDHLIGRIVDTDISVRLAAIRAVGEIREARALTALQGQVDYYRGATAARTALEAIARIAHRSTWEMFSVERFSKNDAHRRYAYEGIARLGGIPATDALAVEQLLAEERDEEVAAAMAFALAAAGRPQVDRVIMALVDPDTVNQALDYVVELGTARPSALVPYLKNSDAIVRERVAMAMGFVADAGVEAALSELTTDGDPSVRRAAETALIRTRTHKRPVAAPRPTP
jgi:HEAT repeat protein